MNLTLQDYRSWLISSGVTGERLNAAMLDAQNEVRKSLADFQVGAAGSHTLFEFYFGDPAKEAATSQSIVHQVVSMLLNQRQQEQFADAVLHRPGDAGMPLDD